MKIRSLRLEHFRKFTHPVVLTGLTDGVNVLAEDNEFGKSTLLAAIRGVLFERHVSKAAGVTQMQHWSNKTSPVIALEFELADGLHKIEKRFLHREPYARLTLPNGALHEGEAAEEHLQRLLNFTPAGKSGSKPDNIGMWAALWITQRESVDQLQLTDSARQTIHGCLDREVGALAGGTRGTRMLASVRADLAKIRDGNKKPAGRHKLAVAEQAAAQQTLAALQARHHRLLTDLGELQTVARKLADTGNNAEEERTRTLLDEARSKRENAQRFEDQEKAAIATLNLRKGRVEAAEKETKTRDDQARTLQAIASRIADLNKSEAAASIAFERAEEALKAQRNLLHHATESCDLAGKSLRNARTMVDLALMAATLHSLRARLVLAEASQLLVNKLVARLASLSVTEPDLLSLRELDKQFRRTEAILEAQATHLVFRLQPGTADRVAINGAPVPAGPVSIIEDATVRIEGIGEILIQPGIQNRETLLQRQTQETRQLRDRLQQLACPSLDQAEEQYAARRHCESDLAQARQELVGHTPADPAHKMGSGLEALRNQVAVLENQLATGLSAASLPTLPELSLAQEALRDADSAEREAAAAVSLARAPLADLQRVYDEAISQHAHARSQQASATEEHRRLAADLELRLQQESNEALAERLSSFSEALLAQQSLIQACENSRPTETVAALDVTMARLGRALQAYAGDRQAMQQRLAVLKHQIEREEGVGIEEQVAAAQHTADLLDGELARYQHETKVLELLLTTLEEAEHEAKERYMAPVIRRVTPYLQSLFPGAAIHCDEQFQITGIIRELQQSESFGGLSVGTQEQIAVLTRLAFADMLVERGLPAAIILDDALVYSDKERIERMFDLLTQAAAKTQILIFTCRGELFTRLGGTRLRLVNS